MSLLETLLSYREMGLPIFPMKVYWDEKEQKNQKRPLVKWQKYQTELPTEDEIVKWVNQGHTSWGMATGEKSGIIVVDVDTDKLEDAEKVLGIKLHSAMMVKTISGGMHIYYKWSEELRNTVRIEDSPVDFRGDGGLVVIPPSFSDKGKYEWVKEPNDMTKFYLTELPEQVKAMLTINHQKVTVDVSANSHGTVFHDGERNAASVVAIRKLLGKMPEELWPSSGYYAFRYWCKVFCKPALDDKQIKATYQWWVRSNAQGAQAPIQAKSAMQVGLERIEERKYEATAPKTGYPKLDYFIKGWIPGHLYIFTGETNAGKTAAACNFAYQANIQGKKVTYFALEPDAGVIEYFAGIHHQKRWNEITDEDLKLDLPGLSIFTKEAHQKLDNLLKTIEEMERQDLIIVDHIGYFTNDSTDRRSKTDQESDALKRIVGVAKKHKTAIMLIAHPRKPLGSSKKEKPLTMNEISGSAAFKQDATDILILQRKKDPHDAMNITNLPEGSISLPKVKTGRSGVFNIRFVTDSPIMTEREDDGTLEASVL